MHTVAKWTHILKHLVLSMRDHFTTVCMKGLKLVLFLLFVYLLILPNESSSKIIKNALFFLENFS